MLWSLLITYGVGMLFNIAHALNEPFGYDVQDVNVNRLCSKISRDIIMAYSSARLGPDQLVDPQHETPNWLQGPHSDEFVKNDFSSKNFSLSSLSALILRIRQPRLPVLIGLLFFTLWSAFIVFLTWGLTRGDPRAPGIRWWSVYIPLTSGTASYVSLGVFLLLGFWLNDAYGRYWSGMQLWPSVIRNELENITFKLCACIRPGTFHQRDHDRILSHIVALPIVAKLTLRKSRDLSELDGILSKKDIAAFSEADSILSHAINVLFSYLTYMEPADRLLIDPDQSPLAETGAVMFFQLWSVEQAIMECLRLQEFPVSPAFTTHLQLFTVFWLALLPLTFVLHDGFLSFLYLLPIGYSIINLLVIGQELADPFGDDEHDVPLDMFCKEIKTSVYNIYQETNGGISSLTYSDYKRDDFAPAPLTSKILKGIGQKTANSSAKDSKPDAFSSMGDANAPTVLGSLRAILAKVPIVSLPALAVAILWNITSVFASWGLSKLWEDDQRGDCLKWCSPIDVDGSVLGNVGFALFLILAFRASDGIARYEMGASLLFDMEMELRTLAIEMVQHFKDGAFHTGDKERVIAHMVQIPLCFRDTVLGIERSSPDEKEGLLSAEDRDKLERSSSPVDHLLQVTESYVLGQNVNYKKNVMHEAVTLHLMATLTLHLKFNHLRSVLSKALALKRFPTVRSYTNHQHMFTALWLALLPLSMTAQTGFVTIMWASLISFGILGMESIASALVDPFGTDAIDIPVEELCLKASNSVLEAVRGADWGISRHLTAAGEVADPALSPVIQGRAVVSEYHLPVMEPVDSLEPGDVTSGLFKTPHESKPRPTLYSHLLHSVPWWVLFFVTGWTVFACIISYIARLRDKSDEARWWVSFISVSGNVTTYVSIVTFALLGFFTQAAFGRYNAAGAVWGDSLRSILNQLPGMFLQHTYRGSMHEGDHQRIIGHIAALPLVLKLELRDSRDMREIMGLLPYSDVVRIQRASSMSYHCVDVLRSYWIKGASPYFSNEVHMDGGIEKVAKHALSSLDGNVKELLFLKSFEIAPGFIVLLNALMGLFFLILPFVLAEISGWFTVLWVPIIGYGLLGMYSVAMELQNPFGTDLNDLDLDKMADEIVTDVLFAYQTQKAGHGALIEDIGATDFWYSESSWAKEVAKRKLFIAREKMSTFSKIKEGALLALQVVPFWVVLGIAAWAGIAVAIAFVVSENFEQFGGNSKCAPWFCSAIAIDKNVMSYIGFALFLLLGSRLNDSHGRYGTAIVLLQGGIVATSRLFVSRFAAVYTAGNFHEGGLQRVMAHLVGFFLSLKGSLRGDTYEEELRKYLHEDDVRRILRAPNQVEYCMNVVRGYLAEGDRLETNEPGRHSCGMVEHYYLIYLSMRLSAPATGCQRLQRVPLPYGYVQHLRIFLLIWVLLLPLSLVESTGWVTALWVGIIGYGVVGIERWAQELSDPFGKDMSDAPLDQLIDRAIAIVKTTFDRFPNGMSDYIIVDRPAFPSVEYIDKVSV